jgi:hypothetical protein
LDDKTAEEPSLLFLSTLAILIRDDLNDEASGGLLVGTFVDEDSTLSEARNDGRTSELVGSC